MPGRGCRLGCDRGGSMAAPRLPPYPKRSPVDRYKHPFCPGGCAVGAFRCCRGATIWYTAIAAEESAGPPPSTLGPHGRRHAAAVPGLVVLAGARAAVVVGCTRSAPRLRRPVPGPTAKGAFASSTRRRPAPSCRLGESSTTIRWAVGSGRRSNNGGAARHRTHRGHPQRPAKPQGDARRGGVSIGGE